MVQLDLFGGMFGEEAPKPSPKKQVIQKAAPVVEAKPAETATPATDNGIVFNDGKIGVKIKVKEQPTVSGLAAVEVTTPSVVAAPTMAQEVIVPITTPMAKVVKEKKEKVKKTPQKRGRKSFKEIDAELGLVEVPDDEILFQKQYYSISIVAKWFRLNTSLLRAWDNEFDILKPRKNRKGDRLFRPEDVKNIQLIYQLLRHKKYTVEGAKEYIKAHKKQADVQLHIGQTLQKFKSFLLEMRATLEA